MAGERVGHSLQATALVNEAYLRLPERMRRVDFGRFEIEFTFDDPKS